MAQNQRMQLKTMARPRSVRVMALFPQFVGYDSEENSSGGRSDDSDEENERIMEARQLEEEYLRNKAAMEQRHRNIQKRKLERRGFGDENDSVFDHAESDADFSPDVKRSKTPYRSLPMERVPFTPPRQQRPPLVPASDDEERGDSSDEEDEDDDMSRSQSSSTRSRRYPVQCQWREVKSWYRRTMQDAEINREVDSILEQSLKDAAYYADHVTKTNATDRAYWKAASVSTIFFLTYSIYRHLIPCSLCNRGIRV
jgi:hypothetical protein